MVFIGATVRLRDADSGEEDLYRLVGELTDTDADYVEVTPNSPMGMSLMKARVGETVMVDLPRGRTRFEIVEVRIPDAAAVVGKTIRDVLLPHHSLIWGIVDTEGNPKTPTADTVLHAGDEVVAVTLQESEEALRTALTALAPERSF